MSEMFWPGVHMGDSQDGFKSMIFSRDGGYDIDDILLVATACTAETATSAQRRYHFHLDFLCVGIQRRIDGRNDGYGGSYGSHR